MIDDPLKMYLDCMHEVRSRSSIIASVLSNEAATGRDDYDYEIVALHLRKILELIAFASISGNLEEYEKAYANAHKHWNAERILADVERINPYFYPIPARIEGPDELGIKHVAVRDDDHLTREDFVQLYKICGSTLHIPNSLKGKKMINFIHHPGIWLMKIHKLLEVHYVKLLREGHMWLIILDHPEDHKVHGYPAEPVPDPVGG